MKDYYLKIYLDGMQNAGYTGSEGSDFVINTFTSYFSECEENAEYRSLIHEKEKDFLKFCAAYAQLKTSYKLGCSGEAPYDIMLFLHLSEDEFHSYVEILPPRLANTARWIYGLTHKS